MLLFLKVILRGEGYYNGIREDSLIINSLSNYDFYVESN